METEGYFDDSDDEGLVHRHGWSYERDSEGQYDTLVFDMNDKVILWKEIKR